MWRTELGQRYLKGAEARMFAETLWSLIDESNLSDTDDYHLGISTFDKLSYPQKIGTLHEVGNALLREDVLCPQLTAVREAAVGAVFEHLHVMIQVELDEEAFLGQTWRQLVAEAVRACGAEEIPESSCRDMEEWEICVEFLADQILWDRDFEEEVFLDHSPESSSELKRMSGIAEDYYVEVGPDPRPEEVLSLLAGLRELCRRVSGNAPRDADK